MNSERLGPPLAIHQRRYLGNKRQLLDFIHEIVDNEVGQPTSLADFFAGTGVVGHSFNHEGLRLLSNELLYANYCMLDAFLGPEPLDMDLYHKSLNELLCCKSQKDCYLVAAYGGKYFGERDAQRIHAMREKIETLAPKGRLLSALIASLLYSADRIANTCGHYDAFRSCEPKDCQLVLYPLVFNEKANKGNEIFNLDVQDLAKLISCDIAYLDPPYNSRQYCDSYHVLENIARWNKPALTGKARKFDRAHIKSKFNLKAAATAFSQLVKNLRCKYILVSYSNMEGKGDPRSRNRISASEMIEVLSSRGPVDVFERPFKAFSAGKSEVKNHAERLFLCRVREP